MGILVIGVAIGASCLFYSFKDPYFEISKNLDIFTTLYREVNTFYVDEVDPGNVMKKAIDAMLKELDPYTVYISEADVEDFMVQTTGSYGGIGAIIRRVDDYVLISEVYEGAPADIAGLIPGDKLVKVNSKKVKGKTTSEVSEILKGQPGTNLKLEIERINQEELMDVEITREEVKIKSVPYAGMLDDETGYILLRSFTRNCAKEVQDAMVNLKKNHGMKSLVIDLRGNPGGLLGEAVRLCNIFIPKGEEVVHTKGKLKEWQKSYKTQGEPIDVDIPLVILVNQGSASASEIIAGTLQDLDRAVIIGRRTYGKGLVQQTRPMPYNSQVKITTAKYYTPSGRCIQALDYAQRNEDGSVGKTPDSLRNPFETRNHRVVYDGGGVDPDIEVRQEEYGNIIISLLKKQLIFGFSNEYASNHESISDVKDFEIDTQIFQSFKTYLEGKDYEYESETESLLKILKETAEDEKYFEDIQDAFDDLSADLKENKRNDVDKYEGQIKEFLLSEIVKRYYYQKGAIQSGLKEDPFVLQATSTLQNQDTYQAILTGQGKGK